MSEGLSDEDLDAILAHRDERVRHIFREEVKKAIDNGIGHAIRKHVHTALLQHEERMRPTMLEHERLVRLMWGDEDGLDVGAVATLREHREMVARIKTISRMVTIVVPLFAVDLLTRFVPIVELLSNNP